MTGFRTGSLLCLTALLLVGCSRASVPGDGSASTGPEPGNNTGVSGTQESDWAAIVELENQAKRLATTTGCTASESCREAPVGRKACGSPRYYIPWCARTTDSAALYAKLDQVIRAENAYNTKYNVVSTCEMRLPPKVGVIAGACTSQ